MSNLKPCPFCGSETSEDGNGGVFCDNAECFILALWLDQTGCANDWNTRPIEDQLRTRIAELEALCAMQQEHEREVGEDLTRAVKWAALWKRLAATKKERAEKYRARRNELDRENKKLRAELREKDGQL